MYFTCSVFSVQSFSALARFFKNIFTVLFRLRSTFNSFFFIITNVLVTSSKRACWPWNKMFPFLLLFLHHLLITQVLDGEKGKKTPGTNNDFVYVIIFCSLNHLIIWLDFRDPQHVIGYSRLFMLKYFGIIPNLLNRTNLAGSWFWIQRNSN